MSDDFKEKLRGYQEGTLSDEERLQVEEELEKIELYQSYVLEMMADDEKAPELNRSKDTTTESQVRRKETSILKRGKWKIRFSIIRILVGLYLVISILMGIGTNLFYNLGDPKRMEVYRNVIESAIVVNYPNITMSMSSHAGLYFNMDVNGRLVKRVGDSYIDSGEVNLSMLFNKVVSKEFTRTDQLGSQGIFKLPIPGDSEVDDSSEWNRLDKLPEGTVAEVYISYNQLYSTEELLKKFEHLNLKPLWLAVDRGQTKEDRIGGRFISNPVGFPVNPLIVLQGNTSKEAGKLSEGEFLQKLQLLQANRGIAESIAPTMHINETKDYIDKNGIRLYGAVVTGPTKELLKLKDQADIAYMGIAQVELWNWDSHQK